MNEHTRRLFARLARGTALCLVLSACASSPNEKVRPLSAYEALYSGKSELAFATQMPVGSGAEAALLGDKAFTQGDLDRALFEYVRALKKGGDNPDVLYKIGLIHASRDHIQLAEAAFRWALRDSPKHEGALAGLGTLLIKKRQYVEAESRLRAAVRINRRMVSAHNALGVLADMQGDYKGAQGHYQDALAIVKKSPEIMNNYGYSLYLSGDHRGAIRAFKDALTADPKYEKAWRNLGLIYARERRYEEALEAFNKVEDLPKAYNDVGYVAMISGRKKDAGNFFEEAMLLSPQHYELAAANVRRLNTKKGSGRVAKK